MWAAAAIPKAVATAPEVSTSASSTERTLRRLSSFVFHVLFHVLLLDRQKVGIGSSRSSAAGRILNCAGK